MIVGMSLPRFSAELNTDVCDAYTNAELTLKLRLGFEQVNPAGTADEGTYNDYGDATATSRRIIRWTPGSWASWKQNFVRSAERFWNGKFWLVNNFPLYEFAGNGATYRPNIYCKMDIVGSDASSSGAHNHTIQVVRLHSSETWFGSHSTLYDSLDTNLVRKRDDSNGDPIMQRAHVHEVGHLLGLAHVDVGEAHCPANGNTNASACYGISDEDSNSVMGSGMQLRVQQSNPWRKAMIAISGRGNFLTATDWRGQLNQHYPRTTAEAMAGAAIIVRPRRA